MYLYMCMSLKHKCSVTVMISQYTLSIRRGHCICVFIFKIPTLSFKRSGYFITYGTYE